MTVKVPIRTVFSGSNAVGLAEFQSGEFIGLTHGGLGASLSIGTAGQVLKVNSGATAVEFGNVEAVFNIDGMTDGSGITIADSDKFPISDGGTEKFIVATQISSYVDTKSGTLSNKSISGSSNTFSNIGNSSLTNSSFTLTDDTSTTTTISLGETLKISGGTGLTSSVSGDDITINLDNTAVTAATYGSTTAIPVIVIDQQGRITSASNAAISTTLTISDDTSSLATIDLGSDTLKISGTSNEIETSISGDTISIGLPNNVTIGNNLTVTGNLQVNGTTTTINSTTVDVVNSFRFEGSTADAFETTLSVVEPTADRTIELPNVSGTIITTGNVTNLGSPIGDLSEISTVANDDVFIAVDTSGGGLKKITRSTIVSGLASSSAISNLVEDTTPQLGGSLDVNGNTIVSVSNGNISILPNGTGKVLLDGNGSTSGVSVEDGLIDIRSGTGAVSKIKFYCEVNNLHAQTLQAQPHSAGSSAILTLPIATGTLIGTGDSGTVTNAMLAGSIANAKLSNSGITIVDDSSTTSSISLGESLKFTGGSGIDTTISSGNVTFSIDNTVPTKAFAIAQAIALG